MRVLEVKWSWALSLVCKVALVLCELLIQRKPRSGNQMERSLPSHHNRHHLRHIEPLHAPPLWQTPVEAMEQVPQHHMDDHVTQLVARTHAAADAKGHQLVRAIAGHVVDFPMLLEEPVWIEGGRVLVHVRIPVDGKQVKDLPRVLGEVVASPGLEWHAWTRGGG